MEKYWDMLSPFVWIVAVLMLVGCSGVKETGQFGSYGSQNDLWDVTRVEHIPDPVRMQVTVVSKYKCTSKREQVKDGESQYTGCTQTMHAQPFTQPGWLISLLQPAMIAAGIWAAGHEIGGMDADQTTIHQQARFNSTNTQHVRGPYLGKYRY